MPDELTFRYRSTYFKHIFGSDGYASGYYTYLWAEVLDTDGFELFKEKGVFDPATAKSFRENILEKVAASIRCSYSSISAAINPE